MKSHEKVARLITFLGILVSIAFFLVVLVIIPSTLRKLHAGDFEPLLLDILYLSAIGGLLIFNFKLSSAIAAHKNWGRYAGIVFGVLSLLTFPIGTIIGVYVLWHLIRRWQE
ncbi:MAG: hypothetical protein HUN04_12400 [Desulfobacter sp.]|nr:MAG: hypothetical protein HUN04_12400 [Desulfobacter sp.]